MTEDTQPGANREVPSDKPMRARKGRAGKKPVEANPLRDALFAALDRTDLNLTEIAEYCGLESPNVLYNFKNGHSESLSIHTYLALAMYLDLSMNELLGIEDPTPAMGASKPSTRAEQPYAEAVRDIVALRMKAEMFLHTLNQGLAAMSALVQRQVVEQPPLSDPEFRFNLIHDVVIASTAMEQIKFSAQTLVDAIEQTIPPQKAVRQP